MAKKSKVKELRKEVELPEGVTANYHEGKLSMKGPQGETQRKLAHRMASIMVEGNKVSVTATRQGLQSKKMVGSFTAHINNMKKGVTEGHKYTLKICSGHFPMNVSVSGQEFSVKNFFGEKVPRVLKVKEGANVKVEGDKVLVESVNKELAGQVSADIELFTRRVNFDTRIFQDGIYIVNKDGKEIK